jgi:glycine hydroxymethyltransferase
MIPDDPRSPFDPSGIRLGTPALTTRGMKETEMEIIADWINEAITNWDNEEKLGTIKQQIIEFTKKFPLYPGYNKH